MLKDYFDVTNQYVIQKLRIICLPFLLKEDDWKPQQAEYSYQPEISKPTPRSDVQAPDLYIPMMSFVTFIILVGVAQGTLNDT